MSEPRTNVFVALVFFALATSPQTAMPADPARAITFDELKFEIGKIHFMRSMLTEKIEALNGQRVTIKGYINPSQVFKAKGLKKFMLIDDDKYYVTWTGLPLYTQILVEMNPDQSADFTTCRITVEGVFSIREHKSEGKVDAVYHLQAEKVK